MTNSTNSSRQLIATVCCCLVVTCLPVWGWTQTPPPTSPLEQSDTPGARKTKRISLPVDVYLELVQLARDVAAQDLVGASAHRAVVEEARRVQRQRDHLDGQVHVLEALVRTERSRADARLRELQAERERWPWWVWTAIGVVVGGGTVVVGALAL